MAGRHCACRPSPRLCYLCVPWAVGCGTLVCVTFGRVVLCRRRVGGHVTRGVCGVMQLSFSFRLLGFSLSFLCCLVVFVFVFVFVFFTRDQFMFFSSSFTSWQETSLCPLSFRFCVLLISVRWCVVLCCSLCTGDTFTPYHLTLSSVLSPYGV